MGCKVVVVVQRKLLSRRSVNSPFPGYCRLVRWLLSWSVCCPVAFISPRSAGKRQSVWARRNTPKLLISVTKVPLSSSEGEARGKGTHRIKLYRFSPPSPHRILADERKVLQQEIAWRWDCFLLVPPSN